MPKCETARVFWETCWLRVSNVGTVRGTSHKTSNAMGATAAQTGLSCNCSVHKDDCLNSSIFHLKVTRFPHVLLVQCKASALRWLFALEEISFPWLLPVENQLWSAARPVKKTTRNKKIYQHKPHRGQSAELTQPCNGERQPLNTNYTVSSFSIQNFTWV